MAFSHTGKDLVVIRPEFAEKTARVAVRDKYIAVAETEDISAAVFQASCDRITQSADERVVLDRDNVTLRSRSEQLFVQRF